MEFFYFQLKEGFENKKYSKSHIKSQIEYAEKKYEKQLKRLDKAQNYSEERKQQLKKFQFSSNKFLSARQFYERLELSILVYGLLRKKGQIINLTFSFSFNMI